ncbi:MAG: TonB-dependent receptor plug domain-containing protein [Opitutaceae bacterium]
MNPQKQSHDWMRWALAPVCAVALAATAWSQASAPTPAPAPQEQAPASEQEEGEDEAVVLSPFEVTSEDDMGYYASHTLSGTRLNTRLRDLGASITVITAQQLADTSSVGINDVFLYEANTEGTHTYTAYSLDRGSISTTTVQQNPQVANRVRGIGSPNRAIDYFVSIDDIPFDSYNVDRITINRGPNSILYGLGSAAGLVNTSPAQANIGQDTNHIEARVGSWGDYRGSFNVNRTLVDDALAFRLAAVHHERGFEREPSHDETQRVYLASTFKPFEKTTIQAHYERYSNDYRRPNANTPQDFISPWNAAGRPTFDPSSMSVRQPDGTLVPLNITSNNDFGPTIQTLSNNGLNTHPHNTRAAFLVENNQAFTRIQRQLGDDVGGANLVEQVAATAGPLLPSAIFTTPGISDRSLYDWDSVNILSGNFGEDDADMYQLKLEQQFTDGDTINKSSGSNFRTRHNRVYYLGDNGVITHAPGDSLFAQIPQPGAEYPAGVVGEPFVHTLRNFIPQQAVVNGVPQVDDDGNPVWAGRDGSTDYGVPGGRPLGTWIDEEVTSAAILHDTNPSMEQTEIESFGGVLQSYWWEERIVTTLGWRKDTRRFRESEHPEISEEGPSEGFRVGIAESFETFEDPWDEVSGNTSTTGVVIHPFRHWDLMPSWLRGFSAHYNKSDTFQPAATEQDLFLNTLPLPIGEGEDYGFTFAMMEDRLVLRVSWYDSAQAFSRSGSGLVTGRARRVENEGSWGFVDMIEREIELREPGLDVGDLDSFDEEDAVTAPYIAEISERSGLPVEWLHNTRGFNDNRTVTSKGMEISLDYNPTNNWSVKFTAGKVEAVNSDVAPQAQEWLFGDGSFEAPAAGSRLDLWQNASFTRPLEEGEPEVVGEQVNWWSTHWDGMPAWGFTPRDWYAGVVESLLRQDIRLQGLSNPQVRKWRWSLITNYRFNEGRLRGWAIGGSMRWEDKAAIGYMGMVNPASGIIEFYDVNRPIYDDAHEYFDFWASYTTRLFDDNVRMRIQANVRNAFESGGLQVFLANPDGGPAGFRIKQPRAFYLTTAFDF